MEKLKKRQRAGMAAPRMNRAQVSAFTGRNNGSESSKLDPRFDSVGLEVNDGIRRAYGPNDMSWNQETWVIIKCEPTPVVMFDEHGLGHWQPMSTKSVPYRMAGYGGTGFLYYPFVELFSGAKVLETKIMSTAQFERRKQHGFSGAPRKQAQMKLQHTQNQFGLSYMKTKKLNGCPCRHLGSISGVSTKQFGAH